MRILFLTPQLPYPPHQGTALRNWGLIEGLARRHDVSLLSFYAPDQDPEPASRLRHACRRVEALPQPQRGQQQRLRDLLLTLEPDMACRLYSAGFGDRLARWLAETPPFDVVHIEGIELAPYLEIVKAVQPRPLIVFDDHNCEYLLQKRTFLTDLRSPARWPAAAYSLAQWRRLRRYEARTCRSADRVLSVSLPDSIALRQIVPGLRVAVIPNGVDTQVYHYPESHGHPPMGDAALVFTGKMDFRPNVDAVLWFARRVLPLVRAEMPQAHFYVVGQKPHPRLGVLKEDPAVTLTGWVDDVRPYIAGAALYVAPLRMGGGTRLKLLEAMAMEKAVVATHLGAEGFPVSSGQQLVLADSPQRFAAAVLDLLRFPQRRVDLGRAARSFVEAQYDWRVIIPRLEAVYH